MDYKEALRVMQLDKNATLDQLNKSYKNLARINHPDMGGSYDSMVYINEARDVLEKWIPARDARIKQQEINSYRDTKSKGNFNNQRNNETKFRYTNNDDWNYTNYKPQVTGQVNSTKELNLEEFEKFEKALNRAYSVCSISNSSSLTIKLVIVISFIVFTSLITIVLVNKFIDYLGIANQMKLLTAGAILVLTVYNIYIRCRKTKHSLERRKIRVTYRIVGNKLRLTVTYLDKNFGTYSIINQVTDSDCSVTMETWKKLAEKNGTAIDFEEYNSLNYWKKAKATFAHTNEIYNIGSNIEFVYSQLNSDAFLVVMPGVFLVISGTSIKALPMAFMKVNVKDSISAGSNFGTWRYTADFLAYNGVSFKLLYTSGVENINTLII